MSSTNGELPNVQENTTQILNDIQSLQTIEQQLFSSLEENTGLTTEQQKKVVDKINGISKMRINLYETLNGVNSFFQNALANSKGTLSEQTAAIDIVEKELNTSKNRLKVLEEEKNNKIRLVEINDYYGQKYAEHSDLMKIIVIMLIPILILAILFNKGILPEKVYYILIGIVAIIGGVFIWRTVFSIMMRDPMNYQEYNWYFDPNNAPTSTTTSSTDPWASTTTTTTVTDTCVGNDCCSDGLVYDSTLNQCITSNGETTSTTTTESFVNDVFTKPSNNYKKPDVVLGSDNIKSNNSKSFINYKKF
jgi:flagellar motility protein MotE (MotC chaperone)